MPDATLAVLEAEIRSLKEDIDRLGGHLRNYHGSFLTAINGDNGNKGIKVRLDRLEQIAAASVQAETLVRVTALEMQAKGISIVRDLVLAGVSSIVTAVLVGVALHFLRL